MKTFETWCCLKGERPLPADPQVVAAFIADCSAMGADKTWDAVKEISIAHLGANLADPTAGGPAALAMNALSKIDAPRSWRKGDKIKFYALPFDLQVSVAEREARRDKTMRQGLQRIAEAYKASRKA